MTGSFLVNTPTVLDKIMSAVLYYSHLNRFPTDVKLANGQCSVCSTVFQGGLEVWKYHSGIGDKQLVRERGKVGGRERKRERTE